MIIKIPGRNRCRKAFGVSVRLFASVCICAALLLRCPGINDLTGDIPGGANRFTNRTRTVVPCMLFALSAQRKPYVVTA